MNQNMPESDHRDKDNTTLYCLSMVGEVFFQGTDYTSGVSGSKMYLINLRCLVVTPNREVSVTKLFPLEVLHPVSQFMLVGEGGGGWGKCGAGQVKVTAWSSFLVSEIRSDAVHISLAT